MRTCVVVVVVVDGVTDERGVCVSIHVTVVYSPSVALEIKPLLLDSVQFRSFLSC